MAGSCIDVYVCIFYWQQCKHIIHKIICCIILHMQDYLLNYILSTGFPSWTWSIFLSFDFQKIMAMSWLWLEVDNYKQDYYSVFSEYIQSLKESPVSHNPLCGIPYIVCTFPKWLSPLDCSGRRPMSTGEASALVKIQHVFNNTDTCFVSITTSTNNSCQPS